MEEDLLIPLKLAREGFGGTPQQIADMRLDYVLGALELSAFHTDFEETFTQINKPSK